MNTRTATKRKATIVEEPQPTLIQQLSAQIPEDWRRQTVAAVAGLATSLGTGYIVAVVTEYAIVGALSLTGSAFMGLVILMLGLIVAMYIGSKSSMFVYANIVNKNIDAAFAAVRGFVGRKGVTT